VAKLPLAGGGMGIGLSADHGSSLYVALRGGLHRAVN